eukprot:Skav208923  [mRNA]  locus=scaffold787:123964:126016:+ [translate_table: standard]
MFVFGRIRKSIWDVAIWKVHPVATALSSLAESALLAPARQTELAMLSRVLTRSAHRITSLGQTKAVIFGSGGDPRGHLNPDGTRPEPEDIEDALRLPAGLNICLVVSQDPPKPIAELYGTHQDIDESPVLPLESTGKEHIPHYPRGRLILKGNYKLTMKATLLLLRQCNF